MAKFSTRLIQLRAKAAGEGYRLLRAQPQNHDAPDEGTFLIVEMETASIVGELKITDIEAFLEKPRGK